MTLRLLPSNFRPSLTSLLYGLIFLSSFEASAYNSEEHKLIVDRGAAMVDMLFELRWPDAVITTEVARGEYRSGIQRAKNFAAGFATNNPDDARNTDRTQDHCYRPSRTWGQAAYNDNIWIPNESEVPDKVILIQAEVGSFPAFYTIGELTALYGDYRRTVSCETAARCFLTNKSVDFIDFPPPDKSIPKDDCPTPFDSREYLRYIASGVVPPFGSLGNITGNSAGDTEYNKAGWWGDEMLRIANVNDSHFSNTAVAWYIGMHSHALRAADQARANPAYWARALHFEASALHSLTDLFAFGHAVTNRDRTSFGAIKNKSLEKSATYDWMESVLELGGGQRSKKGAVTLDGTLPRNNAGQSNGRIDFLGSYLGSWVRRAKGEHTYHNSFNDNGADVRNLMGDRFEIFGDGKLRIMEEQSREVLYQAVRASIQSLIDAYACREDNRSWAECHTGTMNALLYLPVFVERDGRGYFQGQWLLYAKAINDIAGARLVPTDWERCKIPFLDGKDWTYPKKPSAACTHFPEL